MIRKAIFWAHLAAGIITGLVVLTLCLTGALLAFERQIVNIAERDARALPPSNSAEQLPPAVLLANAAKIKSGKVSNIEWLANPRSPVRVVYGDRSVLLLNGWTGEVLGPGANSLRGFFHFITNLHVELTFPEAGKWIVDVSNVTFLFLLLSGLWLWWPRHWRWKALRSSIAFRWSLRGKARDWNWHNALGFWFLTPLLVIVLTGLVLSYKGVNEWWRDFAPKHFLAAKVTPVVPPAPQSGNLPGWKGLMETVTAQFPGWQSVMIGNPTPENTQKVVSLMVFLGPIGQRTLVHTISIDPATNTIVKTGGWESDEAGLRARAIARFGHTGEILGPWGQLLALLACLAGIVLVYTGFALSWRRFPRRGTTAPT